MRKKRIEYLAVTSSVFVSGFLLYFLVALLVPQQTAGARLAIGFLAGLMAGVLLAGIVSGAILFARLMSKAPLWAKILCGVFFFITFIAIFYAGVFSFMPYAIYNLVKVILNNDPPEPLPVYAPPGYMPAPPYGYYAPSYGGYAQ